jgi:hypothetical protein
MKEHEHALKDKPEAKPAHGEVAKKAYAIYENYEKEGRPKVLFDFSSAVFSRFSSISPKTNNESASSSALITWRRIGSSASPTLRSENCGPTTWRPMRRA